MVYRDGDNIYLFCKPKVGSSILSAGTIFKVFPDQGKEPVRTIKRSSESGYISGEIL
jgi:hypothetical protein